MTRDHSGWKKSGGLARGRALVAEVIKRHRLHPRDFYGRCRSNYLVVARRDAAMILRDAGYSLVQMGIILQRSHATALNYLPEGKRAKQWARARDLVLQHLCRDSLTIVESVAEAEGVPPALLIAQWVAERATYEAQAKARAA